MRTKLLVASSRRYISFNCLCLFSGCHSAFLLIESNKCITYYLLPLCGNIVIEPVITGGSRLFSPSHFLNQSPCCYLPLILYTLPVAAYYVIALSVNTGPFRWRTHTKVRANFQHRCWHRLVWLAELSWWPRPRWLMVSSAELSLHSADFRETSKCIKH